jgi:hypothetical protein
MREQPSAWSTRDENRFMTTTTVCRTIVLCVCHWNRTSDPCITSSTDFERVTKKTNAQCIKLFQCTNQGFRRWWIHKIEMQQVIDPQTLEHEHHIAEIGPCWVLQGAFEA